MKYKPYLYNLRQCLACEWVMDKRTPPPIEFQVLADAYLPENLNAVVEKLLKIKKSMSEKDRAPHIPEIDEYVECEVQKVEDFLKVPEEKKDSAWEELDSVFLSFFFIFPQARNMPEL